MYMWYIHTQKGVYMNINVVVDVYEESVEISNNLLY